MKALKAYRAYIKDNPEGYWFKRKLYGWGWTPATREGWLVTLGFLAFIILVAWRAEQAQLTGSEVTYQVVVPFIVAVVTLIGICWRKGESPRWQWRIPKKYYRD